jgi:hypothetical protein
MSTELHNAVVTDIKMPFGAMVGFMVKSAIATIPAIIILTAIGSIIFGVLSWISGRFVLKMGM